MPTACPTVTVVVATRDRPGPLRRAVAAILDQNYGGSIECIVVFDQSEITPIDVATGPTRQLRLVTNERSPGLAGARNTGISTATGELIAFCDDDDEWLPDKLAAQVQLLEAHPELVVAGCHITLVGRDSEVTRQGQATSVAFDDLLASRIAELHPSTFIARRSMVTGTIGLIDEEIPGSYAEDYDWLLRAAKHGPIRLVDRPLVRVTFQTGSMFARRWDTIIAALTYILDKHPEFVRSRRGVARIEGQIGFAYAAAGRRREGLRWSLRALRRYPGERRAYLAAAVCAGVLPVDATLRIANRYGRAI
jgi:glycosyltransferase involved in cell wall biosynthesis